MLENQWCLEAFQFIHFKAKSQPEAQVKQVSELLLKKMNKKLEKYKNSQVVLEENFPLYMLLIVHLHRWEPLSVVEAWVRLFEGH